MAFILPRTVRSSHDAQGRSLARWRAKRSYMEAEDREPARRRRHGRFSRQGSGPAPIARIDRIRATLVAPGMIPKRHCCLRVDLADCHDRAQGAGEINGGAAPVPSPSGTASLQHGQRLAPTRPGFPATAPPGSALWKPPGGSLGRFSPPRNPAIARTTSATPAMVLPGRTSSTPPPRRSPANKDGRRRHNRRRP